jgi:hypothetical protein
VPSEALGRDTDVGQIIHGDDHATVKAKTSALTVEVRKRLEKVAALLSNPTPPDLVLNRHCAECKFQSRCRQKAMSPRRVRVSMHHKSVPPLQKAEVTDVVGAARSGCLAIDKRNVSTVWWEESVGRCPAAGALPPHLCLSKTLSGLQRSPATPT